MNINTIRNTLTHIEVHTTVYEYRLRQLTGAKKSTKKGRFGVMTRVGKSSGPRVWTFEVALSLANTAMS